MVYKRSRFVAGIFFARQGSCLTNLLAMVRVSRTKLLCKKVRETRTPGLTFIYHLTFHLSFFKKIAIDLFRFLN
jgi:hypothetical protein